MDKYDFIECVIYDIHSVPRGRMVARRRIMKDLKKGIGLYSGMCYFGIKSEPNSSPYFGTKRNYGNAYMVPILDTLVDAPKSACNENKVGQVLCDLRLLDGNMEPSTPRYVAQCQVEKLAAMGLSIRSAHEIEFTLLNDKGGLWGHDAKWADMDIIRQKQDVLLDFWQELSESGVHMDTLQCEAGPGQYEVTMDIAEGLKGPDMTSRFKSIAKLFFSKRNVNPTFITKLRNDGLSNGFHFNHSLWNKDGQNVFLDLDQPNKLSVLGRQWLAGILTHAPALTALCCPTMLCYHRLHRPWTPSKSDYQVQNRFSSVRLVTECDNNIYLECRIPSSACNAYVVLAAIIAAGLDGVNRQLSLDDVDQEVALPRSLEEALDTLEADAILVESLGKEFVECFTYVKRKFEIEPLTPEQNRDYVDEDRKFDEELYFYYNI